MSVDNAAQPRIAWADVRTFVTLAVAAACGAIALQPFRRAIATATEGMTDTTVGQFAAWSVTSNVAVVVAAAAVGLVLGRGIGLGAPLLERLSRGVGDWQQWRWIIRTSIAIGAIVGSLIVLADLAASPLLPTFEIPQVGLVDRYLAALHGGINEEILLRLGLMTVMIRLVHRLVPERNVSQWSVWTAVVATAVVSGIVHLPAMTGLADLAPAFAVRTVLTHGFGGVVFGWLYLRRGLAAAMIAHVCADMVIHTGAWMLS